MRNGWLADQLPRLAVTVFARRADGFALFEAAQDADSVLLHLFDHFNRVFEVFAFDDALRNLTAGECY